MSTNARKVAIPAKRAGSRTSAATTEPQMDLGDVALDALLPGSRISRHFFLHQLTRSEVASRQGIANDLSDPLHLRAAIHLARNVLDRVWDQYGPFTPNSVYRSQALERVLKHKPSSWISTSQHTRGEACDIEIAGTSTLALAQWIEANLAFDQLICECYDPGKGPNSGWVHVSLKPPFIGENRRQRLSYIADGNGGWKYVDGLRASP
jgi:hypothetical protein